MPLKYSDMAAATLATPVQQQQPPNDAHAGHTVCLRCSRGMAQLHGRVNRLLDNLDDAVEAMELAAAANSGQGNRHSQWAATAAAAASRNKADNGGADFSEFVEHVLSGQLLKYRSSKYGILPLLLALLDSPNVLVQLEACRALARLAVHARHRLPIVRHRLRTIVRFLVEQPVHEELARQAERVLVLLGFPRGRNDLMVCGARRVYHVLGCSRVGLLTCGGVSLVGCVQ